MENVVQKIDELIHKSRMSKKTPQFTYIIGANGTGKTRILRALAIKHAQNPESLVSNIPCITNSVFDKFAFSAKQESKVIYHGLRASGNAIFLAAVSRQLIELLLKGIAERPLFLKTLHEALDSSFSFQLENTDGGVSELESLIDKRRIRNSSISKKFTRSDLGILKSFLGSDIQFKKVKKAQTELLLRYIDLYPKISITVTSANGQYEFSQLSSGEQNRILLAVKILSSANERSLIVIDEPEISLHLQWQIIFPKFLFTLLARLAKFHVVIATHSPVIVSEAAKLAKLVTIIELLPNDVPSTNPHNKNATSINFKVLDPDEQDSFESIVRDGFRVNPHNAEGINKQITEIVLRAAERKNILMKDRDKLLNLVSIVGITDGEIATINQAVALIDRHFPVRKI